ncbi:Bax inhibitor-1/YccA family protein [Candidatus Deianiraea vastatrix]|uniref:Conserved inner-membrane protein n=1 Tax=Candidatus Deianiraea vastatrix TaxID=2163644 RepID=A0A5B8XDA9_9RICK|nr:Bax inhibitor-1/YccA family protein [Candidatus Deianiraea vastatrix]QED23230.1 Putative conserved inner-membrane protein [Candidatus Deianiraea vastatrix]
MAETRFNAFSAFGSQKATSFNQGLREYMLNVYNYMTIALGISGVVAFFMAYSGLAYALFSSPLGLIVSFAPLIMSFYLGFKFHKMDYQSVRNFLLIYSVLMGVSLSSVFLVYSSTSIAISFFITAGMFGSMSIYGYTTKKDLTAMGSFLIMGAMGLLIAMLVNMFMHSSAMSFMISVLSVIIFTGLTAYDTQKIKEMYYVVGQDYKSAQKVAVFGAFQLYMDFIVIFVHMLRFVESMRRD